MIERRFWIGKKVLITGHTGFKGGWLSLWLKYLGAKVAGYSLDPITKKNFFNATKLKKIFYKDFRKNIKSLKDLTKCIDTSRPQIIFHLAAQPQVLESYNQPLDTVNTNVVGTANLLEAYEDYELFGTMNINYLRMDEIPRYEDGWQPVVDVLGSGQFFVTTGEVLIPHFTLDEAESGETITSNGVVSLELELEWTYPLAYMELVSGDGTNVTRQRFDLSDTKEFNNRSISTFANVANQKWMRVEVWDIARNGAFSQPIWINN